jgi:hypothetical protein
MNGLVGWARDEQGLPGIARGPIFALQGRLSSFQDGILSSNPPPRAPRPAHESKALQTSVGQLVDAANQHSLMPFLIVSKSVKLYWSTSAAQLSCSDETIVGNGPGILASVSSRGWDRKMRGGGNTEITADMRPSRDAILVAEISDSDVERGECQNYKVQPDPISEWS